MKATVIYPDGGRGAIILSKKNKLRELYAAIGCETVEHISLKGGGSMWLDEEGKFKAGAAINVEATRLLQAAGGIPWDAVVGVVVVEERVMEERVMETKKTKKTKKTSEREPMYCGHCLANDCRIVKLVRDVRGHQVCPECSVS